MWRQAVPGDVAVVSALAAQIHPGFPEDDAVFAERLALYPAGCFIFEAGGASEGYALTHPWAGVPPKLNVLLKALPSPPTYYYLHDVALLPQTRGKGAGSALMRRLDQQARRLGLAEMRLVAVNGSAPFWDRQGFRASETAPVSYGADAVVMIRNLSAR